jgi:hypothetical protein
MQSLAYGNRASGENYRQISTSFAEAWRAALTRIASEQASGNRTTAPTMPTGFKYLLPRSEPKEGTNSAARLTQGQEMAHDLGEEVAEALAAAPSHACDGHLHLRDRRKCLSGRSSRWAR